MRFLREGNLQVFQVPPALSLDLRKVVDSFVTTATKPDVSEMAIQAWLRQKMGIATEVKRLNWMLFCVKPSSSAEFQCPLQSQLDFSDSPLRRLDR